MYPFQLQFPFYNRRKLAQLPVKICPDDNDVFAGPGPAYQMKRMLGTSDHCITKKQAPAYSIGIPYKCTYDSLTICKLILADSKFK